MPSQAALERGRAAAEGILRAHRNANQGAYPETVAVNISPEADEHGCWCGSGMTLPADLGTALLQSPAPGLKQMIDVHVLAS